MNIPLSKRLQVCAAFVHPGDRIADIGCDHGYLSIYLLKNQIAASAIASDINEGPLQSARQNALRFGVEEHIRFYLSDGVQSIPRDFDTLICAGMGGDTMISILRSAPWLRSDQFRLILQCQTRSHSLRRYLSHEGWWIREERVLRDGRFLYTVMEVLWQPEAPRLTAGQWYFPPALLKSPGAELWEYYDWILMRLRRAINGRGENADPNMLQVLQELENDEAIKLLKEDQNDNG